MAFIFSLHEILDLVIMSLVIGYIFKDLFPRRPKVEVLLPHDLLNYRKKYNWSDFWFAVAVVAPSIILHEFGHKFIAIGFGMQATFNSPISIQHILNPMLIIQDVPALLTVIVLVMRYFGMSFFFFIPAYTSITGSGTFLQSALISLAGPSVNLLLWLGTRAILKSKKKIKGEHYHFLFLTSRINMFLFIFNMLPIPGFDGFSFYVNLFHVFF